VSAGAIARRAALLLLPSMVQGACTPSLGGYIDSLDPGGPIHAKAVVEPERASAPVVPRHVVVCRFTDERAWSDTFHLGKGILDGFAYVFSLGFAAGYDALHPQHRDQPMGGLERDLPRRVAGFLEQANTFASCRFVDHSLEGLKYLKGDKAPPASTDLVLTGSVRAFTGAWETQPTEGPKSLAPISGFRGRIEAVVTLQDARTHAELWSGAVSVDEPQDDVAWTLKDDTECTLRNKLAVCALGAFLKRVDATLREQLTAVPPPR
jgi:hypothetical protein